MAQFRPALSLILIFVGPLASEIKAQAINGPCTNTGARCIDSCRNSDGNPLEDGNYQWCEGCRWFVQCSNGILYHQPCGTNQVWHDLFKACLAQSTTCVECIEYKPPDSFTTEPPDCPVPPVARECTTTGPLCIESCANAIQGNYQWCGRCDVFLQCVGGVDHFAICPRPLVYDHGWLRCDLESTTCSCIDPVPPPKYERLEPRVSAIHGLFSRPGDQEAGKRFYLGYFPGRSDEEGWSECEAACARQPMCNSYTFISNNTPDTVWMGECMGTNDEHEVRVEDPYSFSGVHVGDCSSSAADDIKKSN